MKKLLLASVVLFSCTTAISQNDNVFNPNISKTDWLVGGSLRFMSSKYEHISGSITRFRATPDVGYFVTDKLALGLRSSYSYTKQPNVDAFSTFETSAFGRYYFLPETQKVNVFADFEYGIGTTGQNNKESFNHYGIKAGPAIFLNEHTALEGAVFYDRYWGDAYPNSSFYGLGVCAGFQIHLDCSKVGKQIRTETPSYSWMPDISKGDWLIGGGLSYENSKYVDNKTLRNNSFMADLKLGYGIRDRLFGGARIDFSSDDYSTSVPANTDFTASPFLRYYFLPTAQHTNIYADLSYGLGSEGSTNKDSYNYFGVMAGPAFFVNRHTSVEAGLTYRRYGGDAYPNTLSSIGFRVGLQIHLDGGDKAN